MSKIQQILSTITLVYSSSTKNRLLTSALVLGLITLPGCSIVDVHKVDDKHFNLTAYYDEPVMTFNSFSLASAAKKRCPEGYIITSRQAIKAGAFIEDGVSCIGTDVCSYALKWRIQCEKQLYKTFSLFSDI